MSFRFYAILLIAFSLFHFSLSAQEICNNAIDDDLDGLIDLNDTSDCVCTQSGLTPSSLIPNPSFEEYTCVPQGPSELSCAVGWQQATLATTDFFLHVPGGFSLPNAPATIPDGLGYTGFIAMDSMSIATIDSSFFTPYLEYLGTCLNAPMQAGVAYRLKLSLACSYISLLQNPDTSISLQPPLGPVELSIFGSAACATFPVSVPFFGCPIGVDDWAVLDTVIYQPNGEWLTVNFDFTPTVDIQSVIIGASCSLPADYSFTLSEMPYFLADNLILNQANLFSMISDSGSVCRNTLRLSFTGDSLAVNYQWYFNGVAILGETDTILQAGNLGLGAGRYQLRVVYPDGTCHLITRLIAEPPATVPQISSSRELGCPPLSVQFTNNSGSDIDSCFWDFGDGNTSTLINPTHTYTQLGNYTVTLRIKRSDGCFFENTFVNEIRVLIEAGDTLLLSGGLCTSNLEISGGSDLPGPVFEWSLNGAPIAGETDSILKPVDLGLGEGTYRLLVSASNGRCAVSTVSVAPPERLIPLLGAEREKGCSPLTTRFTNLTQGNVGSCTWNFGNGTQSAECEPQAIFSDPGTYTVSLRVVSAEGCGFDSIYTNMIEAILCKDSSGVVIAPNVFTPNGDGTNEFFSLVSDNLSYLRLSIYDRWGSLVFEDESNNPRDDNPTWNALSKGSRASSGVYYYLYTAKDMKGKYVDGNGFFHLLGQ
ncbi:MAG: PKD domain-containing protein [Bacteroidota bacterium]|jgi:gliding motility-associated-like protein